ncbi:histone-lysine N-methyltransferase Suv4-20-like, partial [Anopheles ziemanni]
GSSSTSYGCSCGNKAGSASSSRSERSKTGVAHSHHSTHHHQHHQHHHHQPHAPPSHSTISSSIRKELASYENPYQLQCDVPGKKKPTKRNASTESLDLFANGADQQCTCGLYSPSAVDGGRRRCGKCSPPDAAGRAALAPATGQKKHNSSKFKDASTSPKSNSPLKTEATCRSPKMEASTDTKFDFNCSPKTESHYRRLSTLSINSGSAAGSRHVATSPMKHAPSPKVSPQKLTPQKTPDHQQQRTLEKSNSLGDSKPPRLLRNTRSLSPRPPVRHQHSIMVSDENDIISVKLSPNEEFEDDGSTRKVPPPQKDSGGVYGKDAKSDPPSMASEAGAGSSLQLNANSSTNRSTSCLVYVPSDPWTRMSASNSSSPASKQEKSKTLDNSGKSYGKGSSRFDCMMKQTDPWVWRSNVNLPASGGGGGGSKGTGRKRNVLTHQTKSLTASSSTTNTSRDDCELPSLKLCQQQSLGRIEKTLTIPGVDGTVPGFNARKKITRPKLQRSKSPSFYEDFFQQPPSGGSGDSNKSPSSIAAKGKSPVPPPSKMEKNASNSTLNGHANNNNNNNNNGTSTSNSGSFSSYNGSGSPTARKQPSPKLSFLSSTPQSPGKKLNHHHHQAGGGVTSDPMAKASLNLLAPNHLQPRHSFSTPSQKDDELQLNIRRLSEQMNKYSHSAGFPSPPAFLNDTIQQQQHQHQQSSGVPGGNKKMGGSGSSLGVGSIGGSIGGLGEASQRKTASHSKINEPILETRC